MTAPAATVVSVTSARPGARTMLPSSFTIFGGTAEPMAVSAAWPSVAMMRAMTGAMMVAPLSTMATEVAYAFRQHLGVMSAAKPESFVVARARRHSAVRAAVAA